MTRSRRATHGSPVTWVARHGPYCFYFVAGHGDDNASHAFPCTQTPGYEAYNAADQDIAVMNQEGQSDPMEWDEYGTPGLASLSSLRRALPAAALSPAAMTNTSADWVFHRAFGAVGAAGSPYWADRDAYLPLFGPRAAMIEEVRVSQWAQAEGLRYANQAHRRRMPHRSMCAFWSYNEPFANAAYLSVVDFYHATKMAYHAAVRRPFAPIDVSLRYSGILLVAGAAWSPAVWAVSERPAGFEAELSATVLSLSGDALLATSWRVHFEDDDEGPGSAQRLGELQWTPPANVSGSVVLVRLRLATGSGAPLAEQVYVFGIIASGGALQPPPLRPLLTAPNASLEAAIAPESNISVASHPPSIKKQSSCA